MQEPEDGVTLEEELERALSATLSTQDAVSPDTADADEPENCEPVVSSASEETTEPTTAEATLADATLVEAVGGGIPWVPFAVYLAAWIGLAALSAYLLRGATAELPARWMPEYVPLLWAGVGLTAAGPLVSLAVWLVARVRRPEGQRRGLVASAMTRGALAALFGVIIWVATLYVIEAVTMNGAL